MEQCVVRRAIKAIGEDKILGYELLFENSEADFYVIGENAVADTIASFLINNSGKIFKQKQIFLTFTPSLLLRNTPKIFQKEKIVIQISDNLIIHPLAMTIIEKYYKEGYRFAINDFKFAPKYFSMLEYASYVRIRMKKELSERECVSIENIIRMAKGMDKKCILTDIDSKETYELALKMEADYVEGNYIAETFQIKTDKVEYMQGNFFHLVVAVSKEEPDMAEIEEIISRDAWLTYSLLKLINSAYFALRRRTASIRQAIMTMGINQLRQWVYMMSLKNTESEGSSEILRLSFLRAKFAEILVQETKIKEISPSEAYMMGMFSTLEYMVDAPLEELLAEIPVSEPVKKALLKGEGQSGEIKDLIICYENADWDKCQQLVHKLGIPISRLTQDYINCVEEVNSIWESLTTEYIRPGEEGIFEWKKDTEERIEDILQ